MKIKKGFSVFALSAFMFVLLGCDLFGQKDEESPPPYEEPTPVTEEEYLLLSHLDEHPVREEKEVTAVVESFARSIIGNSDASFVITGEPESLDVTLDTGFAVRSAGSGEKIVPESSSLPFYRYTVADTATNKTGAIIASGDKRLGNIIAYIEDDTDVDDPNTGLFMGMLADSLSVYVQNTIEEYNSVSQEEIEAARQLANTGTAPARPVNRNTIVVGTDFPPLVKTKWNQGEGYYAIVNTARGTTEHLVGCVAVAMGQLMAYHEWPDKTSLTGTFHDPFHSGTATSFSTVVYDWEAMMAYPWATDSRMTANGKLGINVLLYEAGVKVGMTWRVSPNVDPQSDGSTAPTSNILPALGNMGYNVSQSWLRDYNYSTVVDSINHLQPVIIVAYSLEETRTWTTTEHCWLDIFHWFDRTTRHTQITYKDGHAWIIDDYEVKNYVETGFSGSKPVQRAEDYVHCNLGWGGSSNGWYRSGVFNTNETIDDTQRSVSGDVSEIHRSTVTQGTSRNYRYKAQIIPYLMPIIFTPVR
jgi:hypothetical protein